MVSLYVHVPWCRSKCRYCAFHSVATGGAVPDGRRFTEAIAGEIRERAPEGFAPEAVYIGGGTPSLLGAKGVSGLCHAIRCAADLSQLREWTFEANPDSLDAAVCEAMLAGGATRLSLGAQSFDNAALRWLGRPHGAEAIRRAVETARAAGFESVGVDLIAGIPGVDGAVWRRTLDAALELGSDHVSVYALTVEEGTPLAADVEAGRVTPVPDDAVMDALAEAEDVLGAGGLARYEISNYAKPGRECLYNLSVWRGEDYLGVGPSAASRMGRERRTNPELGSAEGPKVESLSPEEDWMERFLTGLRIAEGADVERWLRDEEAERVCAAFARLEAQGVVERVAGQGRWRLTRRGREVADAVARELV